MDWDGVLGKAPESLTPAELSSIAGKFFAVEIYTPERLPLRKIEAVGDTIGDCVATLAARGLDPQRFEIRLAKAPF